MEYRELGRTGIKVSRIAFGTIPFKLKEMSPEQGAELLVAAVDHGVNFFDLAEIYGSHPHMREALRHIRKPVVIASKSGAKTVNAMETSVKRALDEIGVGRLDIFKMHSVDSLEDLEGRRPAWDVLLRAKSEGLVGTVGISTHSCQVLKEITEWPDVEVVLAVLNQGLRGVLEGTMAEMHEGIKKAHEAGKGVYLMKIFAGGNLFASARQALEFALAIPEVASIAVGMQSMEEIIFNTAVASGREVPAEVQAALDSHVRTLHFRPFCKACGTCIEECRYGALTMGEKMPVVDEDKCILCGYCGFACPEMAIKII